jgi:hypothetical protein
MLTNDDLHSVRGITVADADLREYNQRQVLRLHLPSGNILAITGDDDGGLNMADETSVP